MSAPVLSCLAKPGAILLVSTYELGHQPLSLAAPLAHLARAGFAPAAADTAVEALDDAAIRRARLVAVAVPMHTALRLSAQVVERVRTQNPDAVIALYGLYAWLNGDHLLHAGADAVIAGDAEAPLVALARALEDHGAGWCAAPLPGVRTRQHVAAALPRFWPEVVPDRAALPPLRRYARLRTGEALALAGYVEATRGCLHTCLHCPITPIYGGRFIAVPRALVLEDIRQQVRAGARHITFGDPDFLNGPTHALRIARALHAEFPEVTFDATIKVEHILKHRTLFPELRALGCLFVVSAVESLSETVLARLRKGHTRADITTALAIMGEAGITLRPTLVAFTPWTTLDDYLDVLAFVVEHDLIHHLDPVQYTIRLLVPPGSALLDEMETREWLGPLDEAAFTYRWDHPDPRMDALYHRVRTAVERGQRAGLGADALFARVRALALEAIGRPVPDVDALAALAPAPVTAHQRPLPHLTESWFC
jgi:radical SAM superfamily enzyme YgiQ (UPF0313 family)